jgi:hypothetical protein
LNAKYHKALTKDRVQVPSNLGTIKQETKETTGTTTSNIRSFQQGKLLAETLNINNANTATISQSSQAGAVNINMNKIIKRKPEPKTKKSGPKILRHVEQSSQQNAQVIEKTS